MDKSPMNLTVTTRPDFNLLIWNPFPGIVSDEVVVGNQLTHGYLTLDPVSIHNGTVAFTEGVNFTVNRMTGAITWITAAPGAYVASYNYEMSDNYQIFRGLKPSGTDSYLIGAISRPASPPSMACAYTNYIDFAPRTAIIFYTVKAFTGNTQIDPASDIICGVGFPSIGDQIPENFLSSFGKFDVDNFNTKGFGL